MKVTVKTDFKSQKEIADLLDSAAKVMNVKTQEFVSIVAKSTAQRLSHKIHPIGYKNMEKFEKSIASQVFKAMHNAIREGDMRTGGQAHQSRRNTRGQVPKGIVTTGRYQRAPYTEAEFIEAAKRKQDNAGLAKASFVDAGEKVGIGKFKDIPNVVRRHVRSGHGFATTSFSPFRPEIVIGSKITYIRRLLSNSKIATALREGRVNALKYLEREVAKTYKQMERAQKKAAKQKERFDKRAAQKWADRHKLPS
jgi:hypothetical protein